MRYVFLFAVGFMALVSVTACKNKAKTSQSNVKYKTPSGCYFSGASGVFNAPTYQGAIQQCAQSNQVECSGSVSPEQWCKDAFDSHCEDWYQKGKVDQRCPSVPMAAGGQQGQQQQQQQMSEYDRCIARNGKWYGPDKYNGSCDVEQQAQQSQQRTQSQRDYCIKVQRGTWYGIDDTNGSCDTVPKSERDRCIENGGKWYGPTANDGSCG